MEKEKSVVANEIRYYRDNPLLHSFSLFGSNLDKRLSLVQGDEKSLNRITPEMLRLFYNRHYAPQNMVISITGNMEHEGVASAVGSTFGRMKRNRTKAATPDINPAGLPRTETVLNSGQREAYMLFGGRAPAMPDRRRYAMEVAVAALGKTLNSRLFSSFVGELAISRYVGAEYDPVEGAFTGFVATSAKNLPVARGALQELLGRLARQGIDGDELETTKRFLIGYDTVQNEQNQKTAEKYALAELFGKAEDVENYCARMESVTMDDANEAVRDFMNAKGLLTLITRGGKDA
jgi:predicted Zn-dependent peptidase